jgi:hypothetical protein
MKRVLTNLIEFALLALAVCTGILLAILVIAEVLR